MSTCNGNKLCPFVPEASNVPQCVCCLVLILQTACIGGISLTMDELLEAEVSVQLSEFNNTGNWTADRLEAMLQRNIGPRQAKSPICLTVLYVTIFLLGVFGNLCTCIVIIRYRSMHSTTNYYLFSLAISDLLILIVGLPTEVYGIWQSYPWPFDLAYCIFKSMVFEMTSYASVLTITAFTVERYMAICHPLWAHTVSTLSRTLKIICATWLTSLLIALPYPLHTRLVYLVHHPQTGEPLLDSLFCTIPKSFISQMIIMFQLSTFLFFITPLLILSVLYTLIVLTVRRTTIQRFSPERGSLQSVATNHKRSVLKLLVAVVFAFFFCWAPFHIQRLITMYVTNWTPTLMQFHVILFYLSGILYFSHSAINPILYNIMSEKYKAAFLDTFCCRRCVPQNTRAINRLTGRIPSTGKRNLRFSTASDRNDQSPNTMRSYQSNERLTRIRRENQKDAQLTTRSNSVETHVHYISLEVLQNGDQTTNIVRNSIKCNEPQTNDQLSKEKNGSSSTTNV